MANDILKNIGQGLQSFIGRVPLSQIQGQEEQKKLARQQQFMQLDNARKGALFQDARVVNSLLNSGQTDQALNFLGQRVNLLSQVGGDPTDTMEIVELINSGNLDQAKSLLSSVEQAGVQSGFLDEVKKPTGGNITANISDFLFHEQLLKEGRDDEAAAFANKANLSRLSPEEQAQLAVQTSRMKEQDKEKAKRLSGFVNNGVGAADSVGNLKRALTLLDSVKTGGFDNAALRVKQFFGVEGADEGELSNNLGKAVLSQLRETFGAAFTAKEGEQLQRIESGFGKSTETNKRLLNRALKTAQRAAKRGIRAAKTLGDDFSAEEIKLALDSALEASVDLSQPTQQLQQPQTNQPNQVVNWGDL